MFAKFKTLMTNTHDSLLPKELSQDGRKKILFYIAFYSIFVSTFLTVFSQLPMFTSRGLTQIFQVGWVIALLPLLMLDYKQILRYLMLSILLILPFVLYCLFALAFGTKSIQYGGTTYIFLCLFLLLIFGSFSKYKTTTSTKLVCLSFLIGAFLYAVVVFLTKLRGQDISDQIYAFGDKNSAGPIFMCAAILAFYLFDKRNVPNIVVKWLIFLFFVVIIALSKTRSVLITIPIILFLFLFKDIKNNAISLIALLIFIGTILLIFVVPPFRETIIINIFLNGKTDVDSIFSGRLTQIVNNLQNFKPVLGSGGSYFDCMILSFLCTYGIIGFLSLLPFLVFPFFITISFGRRCNNSYLKTIIAALVTVFIASSLLEGYGFVGTGAKVFIFWFFVGNYSRDVFYSFKDAKISKPTKKVLRIIDRIPKRAVMYSINSILFLLSITAISIGAIPFSIGKTVVDKLPTSNRFANYIEVRDIQIDPPVESMCVGQTIKYGVKSDPIDAEDAPVYWSTGWITNPCISVDGYTGEVTANKTGNALLHINRFRVGQNGVYIQYPVVEASQYTFDKFYISSNPFHHSFEHTSSENISLTTGCSSKIFYDNFYLPNSIDFEYVSSNSDVAIVENNLIKAKQQGECEIYAIVHGKKDTISANKIKLSVSNKTFVPVSYMNINLPDKIYQYQKYTLIPTFNIDASDKNFTIKTTADCLQDKETISFLSPGETILSIYSDSNKDIMCLRSITVLENKPSHFECLTNRMLVGETKSAAELGLSLVFQNGYKKILDENDIIFDPSDFTNRAWSNQNGLVKNRTTVKAVKTGSINISFVCKIDQNITSDFTIITSIYTEEQYNALSRGIGILLITFILIISLLFSLFVPFQKRWVICSVDAILCILFLILILTLYGLTSWFIASCVLALVSLLAVITIFCVFKQKMPIIFLEDPIDIIYKDQSFKNEEMLFIEINI